MTNLRDPCLKPFLRMVDGGVRLEELFKEGALRRDSVFARPLQEPPARPLYFSLPRRI